MLRQCLSNILKCVSNHISYHCQNIVPFKTCNGNVVYRCNDSQIAKFLSVLASSKLPCHVEGFLCILLRISVQYFEVCYLPNKACLKIEQLVKSTKYIAIISFLCNMKYKANKSIIKEQHKLICHTNLFLQFAYITNLDMKNVPLNMETLCNAHHVLNLNQMHRTLFQNVHKLCLRTI